MGMPKELNRVVGALALQADLVGVENNREITIEVLPPPVEGKVENRAGRVFLVPNVGKLIEALNGADPKIRLDIDHQTEPTCYAFRGSTAARGWFKNFHLNARGGVNAELHRHDISWELNSNKYRYVSPTVLVRPDGEIIGMTSIALTNAPLLSVKEFNSETNEANEMPAPKAPKAPAAKPTPTADPAVETELNARGVALDAREKEIAAREKSVEDAARAGIKEKLDSAVNSGAILPSARESLDEIINHHERGYSAGIAVVEKFLNAAPPDKPAALMTRTAGHTATAPFSNNAAGINLPRGFEADPQSAALDQKVRAVMATTGNDYETALNAVN